MKIILVQILEKKLMRIFLLKLMIKVKKIYSFRQLLICVFEPADLRINLCFSSSFSMMWDFKNFGIENIKLIF